MEVQKECDLHGDDKVINHWKFKPSCNYYYYSPLHYACRAGHVSCVEHLIKFGASVGLESLEKHTPML